MSDGTVAVTNTTMSAGKTVVSRGVAKHLHDFSLRVDFDMSQVKSLMASGEGRPSGMNNEMMSMYMNPNYPNYVIDKLWTDEHGNYLFAVVTDPRRESLYVLSRCSRPSLEAYSKIMCYVTSKFHRDRLVQTPHY